MEMYLCVYIYKHIDNIIKLKSQ